MKKILLVDDVKLLIEIQKRFLTSSYVEIFEASDGEEAISVVNRVHPDLIIMDKYMPNMDGLTCTRKLKADPATAHIPVIMVTNATQGSDRQDYLSAGCSDVLAKPIDAKMFLNAIKKHIPDIERRSIRIPLNIQTKVDYNSDSFYVVTENLSLNGLFVLSDRTIPINEQIKISFVLPDKDIPIEIKSRVVWNRGGNSPGFGVEFMEVVGQGISMLRISELKEFLTAPVKQ